MIQISTLQKLRADYQPKLPRALRNGTIALQEEHVIAPETDADKIQSLFPNSYGKPLVRITDGTGKLPTRPINVGVVLSGGQAPGGHNVICGVYDALKNANPASRVFGFLGGPKGVIDGTATELTSENIAPYRNTGGFDMIGSGRDKIESPEDLKTSAKSMHDLGITALIVIGGDDSNTNAALMAEAFLAQNASIQVIGVPKTIDGDMKNEYIEASFGFDTAAKTFAELVGNIARDSISAKKYWHFIKLMGRSASHVALEVALQVQPNFCIISEEVEAKKLTLRHVVDHIAEVVARRSAVGKNYGVGIIPEGLLEFLADFKVLLSDLGQVLHNHETTLHGQDNHSERREFVCSKLGAESAHVYSTLPKNIQDVLLMRDKHGNIPVSQVDTEKMLMDLVSRRLREMKSEGKYEGKFKVLGHFFGYEGRCVAPSNFDADYCYALGYSAVQLVRGGLTGYTVSAQNLDAPADEWVMGGVPVTSMINMEMRKGKLKPVIRKALVELEDTPFKAFAEHRENWIENDAFVFPGPIQYWGPSEVADALTKTLQLEQGAAVANV